MAKAKGGSGKGKVAVAVDSGKSNKVVNRKRRNALERKSMPSYLKVLFKDNTRLQNVTLLAAWQEGRKKIRDVKEA